MDYLLHNPKPPVNVAEFEKSCGVGAIVTPEDIERVVSGFASLLQRWYVPSMDVSTLG
jgi:hypothetical protein